MKTTLEIPDAIFRKAKARAAERGIPLRQFVTEAVAEKLEAPVAPQEHRLPGFGALRHLHNETMRINQIIEDEFEQIDPEDWK